MHLSDGGERLLLREAGGLLVEAEALAADADGARRDEDDVMPLDVQVFDGLADGGEVDEVEAVVLWVDQGGGAYFDDLLLFWVFGFGCEG